VGTTEHVKDVTMGRPLAIESTDLQLRNLVETVQILEIFSLDGYLSDLILEQAALQFLEERSFVIS
jgi:hypothetical protein